MPRRDAAAIIDFATLMRHASDSAAGHERYADAAKMLPMMMMPPCRAADADMRLRRR